MQKISHDEQLPRLEDASGSTGSAWQIPQIRKYVSQEVLFVTLELDTLPKEVTRAHFKVDLPAGSARCGVRRLHIELQIKGAKWSHQAQDKRQCQIYNSALTSEGKNAVVGFCVRRDVFLEAGVMTLLQLVVPRHITNIEFNVAFAQ